MSIVLECPLEPAEGSRFTAQVKKIHGLGQYKEKKKKKILIGLIQEGFILNLACGKLICWILQCIVRSSKQVLLI